MENNLFLAILAGATKVDKDKTAVKSEMIQRYYEDADDFGKRQIDKIIMALCGADMIGLDLSLDKKLDIVIEGLLSEDMLGYDKGAEIITTPDLIYGLIKEEGDEHWGYFVSTNRVKIDYVDYHDKLKSTETLHQMVMLTMKGLLKLPANYFD